ncbi:uncharacterized protein LOC124358227 [Homalodisca vitripennis]|uniref:uncharacterized protein LOC124358227 n=1 Tax=Homalodisca vitripennis TaxID=197043 RepID=UPI001EEA8B3C|nr:uncharacterized protein LOC124358227 [Homalodisca vitripennis]
MNPIIFDYSITDTPLVRVSETKDLGVIFTTNLSWEQHVMTTCSIALKILGLLFRVTKPFSDLRVLRTLYCCLIRPHLEYCCVVWSPHQLYLRDSIEMVQMRFLRLAGVRLGFRYLDVSEQEISSYLNLPSLETRRSIHDVHFLYKLVNGIIDCPDLLQKINFQIPTGTRSRVLFARTSVTTSYAANSPVIRM